MEDWKLDFEWLRIRHFVKDTLGVTGLPDLEAVLFLIGIQESGILQDDFTKEEKQDLMHVAVCTLLESDGYYEFIGRDDEGWPHWERSGSIAVKGIEEQEKLLKTKIVSYMESYISST